MVIGAVLIPGAKAPKLVSNDLVAQMKPGSVLVDIAVDQGGCFEDTRPTTHADPTYQVHNSIFYCVANMPGAVPNTSTYALTNVTLPYAVALADKGWQQALRDDHSLALGLNTHAGAARPTQPVARRRTSWRRAGSARRGARLRPDHRRTSRHDELVRASGPTSTTWRSSVGWRPTRWRRTGATCVATSSSWTSAASTTSTPCAEDDVAGVPDAAARGRRRPSAARAPAARPARSWRCAASTSSRCATG